MVSLLPGVHLRELQRLLGISLNSTKYHVASLCTSGEISCQKDRVYSRLFPAEVSESDRATYSFLRRRASRIILRTLASESGLSNKQISERSGLAKSTVSEQLSLLVEATVVRKGFSQQSGTVYELLDSARLLRLLMNSERTRVETVTSRFIDLWDL